MTDLSHLDSLYFIDNYVFNCPFCNRRNVSYRLGPRIRFDWTESKACFLYLAQCRSCEKISLHLSYQDILMRQNPNLGGPYNCSFDISVKDIDTHFFYSVPTSFFALDDRIPRVLREMYVEAEGCRKSNFLTGASACTRKLVYELAVLENAEGDDYESRLKSLKAKRPDVEGEYFDTLLTIQKVTSTKVHEAAYDGWKSEHLRVILVALLEVLHEIYVAPKLRAERRAELLRLKDELVDKPLKDPGRKSG